jgi:hypothetical protein
LAFARFLVRLLTYFADESFRNERGLWCADAERPGVVGIGAPAVWLVREGIRLFFSWSARSVFGCSSVVVLPDIDNVGRAVRRSLSSRALNRTMRNDVVAAAAVVSRNSETAPMEEIDAASGRAAGSEEEGDQSAAIFSCRALPERTVSAGESHERGVAAVAFHRAEARRSRG